MKYLFGTLFLMSCFLGLCAQSGENITVVIKAGKCKVNKVDISTEWKLAPVAATFTSTDRTRDGFNITHSYDEDGMVFFERKDSGNASGILSELQFYTGQVEANKVTPAKLFTGRIKIESLLISSHISWQELKGALKNYTESTSYLEHNYRLAYRGLYLYFQFDQEDTTLLKISVGKDKGTK
jgi:hypothetical protein